MTAQPAIGRNDPCPCGSGKKYKKSCGEQLDGDNHGNYPVVKPNPTPLRSTGSQAESECE